MCRLGICWGIGRPRNYIPIHNPILRTEVAYCARCASYGSPDDTLLWRRARLRTHAKYSAASLETAKHDARPHANHIVTYL